MNTKGRVQVGASTTDNLIAGNRHPVDVCHVVLKEGQVLRRGSVLEGDPEGKYILLGSGTGTGTAESKERETGGGTQQEERETVTGTGPEYILADDVDASGGDTVGTAYRTGEFAENALIVAGGHEITDADRRMLRNAGIFLSTIME